MKRTCPQCQAELSQGADVCPACNAKVNVEKPSPTVEQPRRGSQFGIGAMMLAVAGVGVLLGLFRAAPGLAFVLVMLSAPALIRGWVVISREQALAMAPLSLGEKGMRLLSSFGLVVMVGLSTGVAFFATCFGIVIIGDMAGMGYDSIGAGLGVGLLAQLTVTIGFITWLVYNHDPAKNRIGDIAFICSSTAYSQAVAGGVAFAIMAITDNPPPFMLEVIGNGLLLPFIILVIGFFLGCIGVARKPRFLACMAVGISTAFFVLGVIASTLFPLFAMRSGNPDFIGITIPIVFYFAWLIGGPLLGYFFFTRWRDYDDNAIPNDEF